MNKILIISISFLLLFSSSCKQQKVIKIGSGSSNAMYYPVAVSICKIFNKYNENKDIICEAKISKGAEYNIKAIDSGEFDMGIVQHNLQHDAYMGYANS